MTTALVRNHAPAASGVLFAVLGGVLALGVVLFTCGGGHPDPEATPLVATSTPVPTPPSTPVAVAPTATTATVTPTPRPAVTLYPRGTRPGIAEADAIIDAYEARGVTALEERLKVVRVACPLHGDVVVVSPPCAEIPQNVEDALPDSCDGERFRAAGEIIAVLGRAMSQDASLYGVAWLADGRLAVAWMTPQLVTPQFESDTPGIVTMVVEGDRIERVDFGCDTLATGSPVLPAIDRVDPAELAAPASAWAQAFVVYLALTCATESVAAPCPHGGSFVDEVGGAVARCEAYGGGAIEARADYDATRDAATVLPLDRACRSLRGTSAALGAPVQSATWRTAATEAKVALASIPAFPPRLRVGATVVVNTHSRDRVIVRERPGLAEEELTRVTNGTTFVIDSGPVRSDDKFWWHFAAGGWAAEENLEFPAGRQGRRSMRKLLVHLVAGRAVGDSPAPFEARDGGLDR